MPAARRLRRPIRALLAVLVLGCAALAAQTPRQVAPLPSSNEASLLVGQAERALHEGDYPLLFGMIERLLEMPEGLVPAEDGEIFYPTWRLVAEIVEQLPPEGLKLYRERYDPRLADVVAARGRLSDAATLRTLLRHYPGSAHWGELATEAAAVALELGRPREALRVLNMLEGRAGSLAPAQQAQRIAALAAAGEQNSARRAFSALAAEPAIADDPLWRLRLERLAAFLENAGATGNRQDIAAPPDPAWHSGQWSVALEPVGPRGLIEEDAILADLAERARLLPRHGAALVDNDRLVVRLRGTLWSFDTLTLVPQWRTKELPQQSPSGIGRGIWATAENQRTEFSTSLDAAVLLNQDLRHAVSGGGGIVFTIEGLPEAGLDDGRDGMPRLLGLSSGIQENELIARDATTGRILWRKGREPADPLYSVAFLAAPLAEGEALFVPIRRGDALQLCRLAAASGDLQAEVAVLGAPTDFSNGGSRCALVADETAVFLSTGNGVVAAFDQADLGWLWAATYPNIAQSRAAEDRWTRTLERRLLPLTPPVLAENLVVIAPVDGATLLAYERRSGRLRWQRDRGDFEFLVGARDDALVLGGNRLVCLAANDGATIRWRSVPLNITGQPLLAETRIFVPTAAGIVIVDPVSGRLVFDPAAAGAAQAAGSAEAAPERTRGGNIFPPTANLIATPEAVFAISPNRVVKFADLQRTAALGQAAVQADQPYRGRLATAWTEYLTQDFERALHLLEDLAPEAPGMNAAREDLLSKVCVALSHSTHEGGERLAWLQRAAASAGTSAARAELGLLIGQTLEESGQAAAALPHYLALLEGLDAELLQDADEPRREIAAWLRVVERLGRLRSGMSTSALEEAVRARLSGPEADAEFLSRLYLILPAGATRDDVARRLLTSKLPPELRFEYLRDLSGETAVALEDWPPALLLARGETHVGIGLLDEAAADERAWQQIAGEANVPQSSGLAERLRHVRTSLAKLRDAQAPPFDAQLSSAYAWRLPDGELIVDPHRPQAAVNTWIPVRRSEQGLLALYNVVLGREWSRTPDALAASLATEDALLRATAQFFNRGEDSTPLQAAWPAARHEFLAAVPTEGGLIAWGLGGERGGGERLWEYAVPEWEEAAAGAPEERLLAGPHGVYIVRRGGRVELVGWNDGRTWWRRSFGGAGIQDLLLVGQRLVILTDAAATSVDALTGGDPVVLSALSGRPEGLAAVGETLLAWGDERLVGLDPAGAVVRWERPSTAVRAWAPVHGVPWFAYSFADGDGWQVVDAATGTPVFERPLPDIATRPQLALDGTRLLVASFSGGAAGSGGGQMTLHLAAHDRTTGARHWLVQLETLAPVNLTQLLGHPDLLPVLIARSSGEYSRAVDVRTLAIQLIDKATGAPSEALTIGLDFYGQSGRSGPYLLVTPARIIVQANGALAAYGAPATGGAR